jgi:hypothetical protein
MVGVVLDPMSIEALFGIHRGLVEVRLVSLGTTQMPVQDSTIGIRRTLFKINPMQK